MSAGKVNLIPILFSRKGTGPDDTGLGSGARSGEMEQDDEALD